MGALLTMFVFMCLTLLSAVVAHLDAQPAKRGRVLAANSHAFHASAANRGALQAALGAVVCGIFAEHLRCTCETVSQAGIAGVDTRLKVGSGRRH